MGILFGRKNFEKMRVVIFVNLFMAFVCVISFKPSSKVFFPFKTALSNYDSLTVQTNQKTPYSKCKSCNINRTDILKLCELAFFDKKYKVDRLGTTPNGSVSFYSNEERVLLIGIWEINDDKYGVNFKIEKEEKFISGAVIEKGKMDSVFNELYIQSH